MMNQGTRCSDVFQKLELGGWCPADRAGAAAAASTNAPMLHLLGTASTTSYDVARARAAVR
jgi:hypothetical protein